MSYLLRTILHVPRNELLTHSHIKIGAPVRNIILIKVIAMKINLKLTAVLLALASSVANATNYDFSYTFDNGSAITGSLSGDLNGSFSTNISNVQAFFNGTELTGTPLFDTAWNTTTHNWDNTIEAIVSPIASLNNFIFADSNIPTDFNASNYFYFINDPSVIGDEIFANNLNAGDAALDNPVNASWSLVAQVPEPGTYFLFCVGIGVYVWLQKFKPVV